MDTVTVIVLGYNSKEFLEDCFSSLLQMQDLPGRMDLLFVDNASNDGSAAWVEKHFSTVRVIQNRSNLGFSAGNNVGAREAQTDWIAFLNPDMRVGPMWLNEMLNVARQEPTADCIASRILNWDGNLIDYGGAAMNFYGYGMQENVGTSVAEVSTENGYVLFPCGGAMLIRRDVFAKAGGFDEDYFAFFEDVDLGWRLWVLGYTVRYAGQATVYHHHHGSWGRATERHRQQLYERNTLSTILKNYEDSTLQRTLPAAAQLMSYRAFLTATIEPRVHRPAGMKRLPRPVGLYIWLLQDAVRFYGRQGWDTLWNEGPKALAHKGLAVAKRYLQANRQLQLNTDIQATLPNASRLPVDSIMLPDRTIAYLEAAQSVLDLYDKTMDKRRKIQLARRRTDREIAPLFRKPFVPNYPDYEHMRALHILCDLWSLYGTFDS